MTQNTLVLAIDIEKAGAFDTNDVIAIGASVVDSDFNELDNFCYMCYFPNDTNFESRCMNEFWSKNLDTLNSLSYMGDLNKNEAQREMITQLQEFRKKWEAFAIENNMNFYLVSDNSVYDGGFINQLIFKYLPDDYPIPYSALTKKYSSFLNTHDEQRGLLSVVDPTYKKDWGYTDKILELYNAPRPKIGINHNPAYDAYTIAYDQQILFGIRDKKIMLK